MRRAALGLLAPAAAAAAAANAGLPSGEAGISGTGPDVATGIDNAFPDKTVQRFAFGSCNKAEKPQPAWQQILQTNPDFFVSLGDIVYADKPIFFKWRIPANATVLQQEFDLQAANPDWQAFRKSGLPWAAVWDDHDVGTNDHAKGMLDAEGQKAAERIFLDFVGEPEGTPRRQRGGVYAAYLFGQAPKRTRLILLDNRSFRDEYEQEELQDMLGPEQWAWLRRVLTSTEAEVTIIGSGLQYIPRGEPAIGESWSRLAQSHAKLLSILADTGTSGAFILSGDVHVAELSRMSCGALGYPLYDFTSSGLTHSWGGPLVGPVWYALEMGESRVDDLVYQEKNWGEVSIDWAVKGEREGGGQVDMDNTVIRLRIQGVDKGDTVLQRSIPLSQLQPGALQELGGSFQETNSWDRWPILDAFPPLQKGYRWLSQALGYPRLPSAHFLGQLPRYTGGSLREAVRECAAAPLDKGFTPACVAVVSTCKPLLGLKDDIYYFVMHAGIVLLVVGAFWATYLPLFLAKRVLGPKRFPGGMRGAWSASALLLAALLAFLKAVL